MRSIGQEPTLVCISVNCKSGIRAYRRFVACYLYLYDQTYTQTGTARISGRKRNPTTNKSELPDIRMDCPAFAKIRCVIHSQVI